jgi:hypothetical protein
MSNTKNILVAAVIAGLLSIVGLIGCDERQKSPGGTSQAAAENRTMTNTQTKGNTQSTGQFQTFVTYKYTDPMTGMEAFRLLIPKGWQAQGQIAWSANPALPAQARFRFFNPNGTGEFNLFPTQAYFWTNNRLFLTTNPPGTLRFNTLVMSPMDLQSAFTRVIIPQARSKVSGLRIVMPAVGR